MRQMVKLRHRLRKIGEIYVQEHSDIQGWKTRMWERKEGGLVFTSLDVHTPNGIVNGLMISRNGNRYTEFQIWDEHTKGCFIDNSTSFLTALCWVLQIDTEFLRRIGK